MGKLMKLLRNEQITTQDFTFAHKVIGDNDVEVWYAHHGNNVYTTRTTKNAMYKFIRQVLNGDNKDWVRFFMGDKGIEVSVATEPENPIWMTHLLKGRKSGFRR